MGGQPGAGTPDTAIVGLGRVGQHQPGSVNIHQGRINKRGVVGTSASKSSIRSKSEGL